MIKLAVFNYCHDCPEFEPEVDMNIACNDFTGERYCVGDTLISCTHSDVCGRIRNHLEMRTYSKGETR